ncbi:MAG: prolyl oligopeptidase family serine peptidase [Lachnospiraceae bacterium]|nr:prolyl oligopeptidase family serine peptidase [Lachnospiraceae bacterium]
MMFEKGVYGDRPRLPYRLFKPSITESCQGLYIDPDSDTDKNSGMKETISKTENSGKVPLVLYLHGADAFGDDNESQISLHDIGTVLTRPAMQSKHPCYVLAPQCGPGSNSYLHHQASDVICELIHDLVQKEGRVDTDRLYIYGYSAGAARTFAILKENPGMFAAAIAICGATDKLGAKKLAHIPLRLFHASDDIIVKSTYKTPHDPDPVYYGSADLYSFLKDKSQDIGYTEYPSGYMNEHYEINAHCSWVAVTEDADVWEWLFTNRLNQSVCLT